MTYSAFSERAPTLPEGFVTAHWGAVYAHSDPRTGRPGDRLAGHLARVAASVARGLRGAPEDLRRIALSGALLHDAGKATPWFQAYLAGKLQRSPHTYHSRPGALIAWSVARDWPPDERAALLQIILRHHGNPCELPIQAWDRLRLIMETPEEAAVARDQLLSMDLAGLGDWLDGLSRHYHLDLAPLCPDPDSILAHLRCSTPLRAKRLLRAHRQRSPAAFARDWVAYGALLADDRIDTATGGARFQRPSLPANAVEDFVARHFSSPQEDSINALRAAVSDQVLDTISAHREHRLFTLTAPTGSGKTLAALRAALALRGARSDGAPRILYALPFTSVIDQNHAVLEAVLSPNGPPSSELLLKHHHLSDPRYETEAGDEYTPDGAGRLLVESWRSEVVVTTFYQLLHTFLGGRSRYAVRAGAWLNAVVILDEVQAIPLRYWRPVGRLLRALAQTLGTRFVLMTATRPLILTGEDIVELLPEHEDVFRRLDRLDLDVALPPTGSPATWTLEQAVRDVMEARERGSVLLVLNTRRAVRLAWRALRERLGDGALIALSTDLSPRDRRRLITRCSERLASGEALVVVSTQLIEAGVDLSFQTVIRDLAPLDSVIQAAGRCNRHGGEARGLVLLRQLVPLGGARRSPASLVYDGLLLDATRGAITQLAGGLVARIPEGNFLQLSQAYFAICQDRAASCPVDQLAAAGNYRALREQFRLIDSVPSQAWFVEQDDEARRLWAMWQACRPELSGGQLSARELRARRNFRRVRAAFFDYVVQEHLRGDRSPQPVRRLDPQRYHPVLGMLPEAE